MNNNELNTFRMTLQDQDQSFEEGHYYNIVDAFCDILMDVCTNDCEDGRKERMLKETMRRKLSPDVLEEFFGGLF